MIDIRREKVEQFLQLYTELLNAQPEPAVLNGLSDYLLHDDLVNPSAHKSSTTEYPILSKKQLKRRIYGERGQRSSNLRGETVLEHAGSYGTDGREHRLPVRRRRTDKIFEKN